MHEGAACLPPLELKHKATQTHTYTHTIHLQALRRTLFKGFQVEFPSRRNLISRGKATYHGSQPYHPHRRPYLLPLRTDSFLRPPLHKPSSQPKHKPWEYGPSFASPRPSPPTSFVSSPKSTSGVNQNPSPSVLFFLLLSAAVCLYVCPLPLAHPMAPCVGLLLAPRVVMLRESSPLCSPLPPSILPRSLNPWSEHRLSSTREFWRAISVPRFRKANPKCVINVETHNRKAAPTVAIK